MSTMASSIVRRFRPLIGKTKHFYVQTSQQVSSSAVKLCQKIEEDLGKCTEEHDQTIYEGILSTQIKLVKGFSLTTSAIGLTCQPILFMHLQQGQGNLALMLGTGAFLSFFTFATPLLIHSFSKKYVTEINYNKIEDYYTATTYTFFMRKKQIKFKLQDVKVPDLPPMFTTFHAKNVPLFVDGGGFYEPKHYGKIMGYDKPLKLWGEDDHECSSKK